MVKQNKYLLNYRTLSSFVITDTVNRELLADMTEHRKYADDDNKINGRVKGIELKSEVNDNKAIRKGNF